MSSSDRDAALAYHADGRPGKLQVVPTKALATQRDLSLAYSPGVAEPCREIAKDPNTVFQYTGKGNLVAVVTNGTAVLGLGNIGPLAAKPVMEGKANLFKKFADIDVFDIELDATTADEVVAAVKAIAPTFGGINLEDIKAPEAFEIETRLQEELDIPVFHDDQHGTAIISAAALMNAAELTGRALADLRIVFSGAGAAAVACAMLYEAMGCTRDHIIMFDSKGLVTTERLPSMVGPQRTFATDKSFANLGEALADADVFIGLSVGNVLTPEMISQMRPDPIIFAMANPDPEIPYAIAREARPDAILATGRSDHANQVNNVLGFPFLFRGALDCRARKITLDMKIAAARALAELAKEDVPDSVLRAYDLDSLTYGKEYIIPKPFDPRVLLYVAPAVAKAAHESGVARTPIADLDAYREHLHRLVERSRGLIQPLIQRARSATPTRIVFPDGDQAQVLRAAQICADEGICTPVLLGDPEQIRANIEALRLNLENIEIIDYLHSDHLELFIDKLWQERQRKGLTRLAARSVLKRRVAFGAMMVRTGMADGMVGGMGRPYKDTLQPALQIVGVHPDHRVVSGVYVMIYEDRKYFLGDCTVNRIPSATELASIAHNTASVAQAFGDEPRVAMLSYSDFGEHRHDPAVERVRTAVSLVRARWPDLAIDGEMQADTAIDKVKRELSFPFSTLPEDANVLIFPDLTSGNIAYKLLRELSDAEQVGPLLVGLGAPINAIPVHATVNEIVATTTYTVNQALTRWRSVGN